MATDRSDSQEQSLISHLLELRYRLLRIIATVLVLTVALIPFANKLYRLLAYPLLVHLSGVNTMIATEVAAPFLIPFKLTLVTAVALSIPMILYQLWTFIAPGLYSNERRILLPLLTSSTFLFFAGMAFAYFAVLPIIFGFLTQTAPESVAVMTDMSKYLDFVLAIFFAFGIAFEVPVATVLLVWAGITHPDSLRKKRPYIIVAAFVIGMVLTPPDILSQTLLAVPMYLLFEAGLWFSRWLVSRNTAEEM